MVAVQVVREVVEKRGRRIVQLRPQRQAGKAHSTPPNVTGNFLADLASGNSDEYRTGSGK
jgi:hypothetical protein